MADHPGHGPAGWRDWPPSRLKKNEATSSAEAEVARVFLAEARKEFRGCRRKIERCVEPLNDEGLWWHAGEQDNAVRIEERWRWPPTLRGAR